MSDNRTEFNLVVNHGAMYEQFFREFEATVKRAIRDAVVDEEQDSLKDLREALVHLNIAIQNIDTVELVQQFRTRLMAVIDDLATKHDKLMFEATDEEDSDEPDAEDLQTTDHKHFFQYGKPAFQFDEDLARVFVDKAFVRGGADIQLPEGATVEDAIRAFNEQQQFFVSAWFISDHGNAHRINLSQEVTETCLPK